MGSDAHQHTDTFVDHTRAGPYTPPTVSSSSTTYVKTPEQYMPMASIIAAQPKIPLSPPETHQVVPIVPAAIPALASKKAATPGIIVDQGDKTTALITDHDNQKQKKKYQDMVKSQNDENQKETVFNILGSLADHEQDLKRRQ